MLRLIFRKIINNKWLAVSLVIGCMFAIAVGAAIPMYTSGLYNILLSNEFKQQQEKYTDFPFKVTYNATFFGIDNEESKTVFSKLNNVFYNDYQDKIPLDTIFEFNTASTKFYSVIDQQNEDIKRSMFAEGKKVVQGDIKIKEDFPLSATANIENLVEVSGGRMFSNQAVDGVIEVAVTSFCASRYRISVGDTYYLYNRPYDENSVTTIYVTGIIRVKDEAMTFFSLSDRSFFMDYSLMESNIQNTQLSLQQLNWFSAFDYTKIKISDADMIKSVTSVLDIPSDVSTVMISSSNNYITVLEQYESGTKVMEKTFLLLVIPVILMIGIYVVMISRLMMDREKVEIAMLESRGAGRGQIFTIYFGQAVILLLISFVLGLLLAKGICQLLGAANGFMEFVSRTKMDISFNKTSLLYAFICALLYLAMILIPAYKASKMSIVEYKQSLSDTSKRPFWQTAFIDVILLGISLYFLYNYKSMQEFLGNVELASIDFTLFIAVTMFITGLGLLFIRIFPLFVSFIFFIGKKIWKPSSYVAFTHVSRSGDYKQYIMIFLILTIGIGIFNANTGRTLNENIEDNIRYSIGADAYIVPSSLEYNPDRATTAMTELTGKQLKNFADRISKSEYIENLAVVFYNTHTLKQMNEKAVFTGIDTYQFGKTVELRRDLNSGVDIKNILNVLATYPEGVIISKPVAQHYSVSEGEYFDYVYEVDGQQYSAANNLVVAIVEYWPGITDANFVVMTEDQFSTMRKFTRQGRIYIDKTDNTLDSVLVNDLSEYLLHNEYLGKTAFSDYELTQAKKNSILNGINGILTLDFLISMTVCSVGFIIFWIISIRQRVLQFGILRAMGMSSSELYRMILYEQIMISFVCVIAGIVIGGVSSQLFVPLFERISAINTLYVPFTTYQDGVDYIRIYGITGFTLISGIIILLRFISKLKIDQALKLGED